MKRMIKRLTAVVMTVLMALTALSGCGSGGKREAVSEQENSGDKKDQSGLDKGADSGRMNISVMGIDWGTGPMPDSEMEQYWEELFDVDFDIEWVSWEDYDQKLNTMIAAGSFPDVVQINQELSASFYYPIFTQGIDSGLFVDLKPYLFGTKK